VLPTKTESVEVAELPEDRVRLVGFKETLGPVGETVDASVTVPANPFRLVTVMVEVAVEPCVAESDVGEAETVKSGCVDDWWNRQAVSA
jgi:hypothetical protein